MPNSVASSERVGSDISYKVCHWLVRYVGDWPKPALGACIDLVANGGLADTTDSRSNRRF